LEKQETDDFNSANCLQECVERREKIERKRQELEDQRLTQKLQIQLCRDHHCHNKLNEIFSSCPIDFSEDRNIRAQWEHGNADVDDVAGGICLAMLLPRLQDIKVKVISKGTLEIEAFRKLEPSEDVNCASSQFAAEFEIVGETGIILFLVMVLMDCNVT
jgi:hypothetical protein